MFKKILILLLLISAFLYVGLRNRSLPPIVERAQTAEGVHEFRGKHMTAEYLSCNREALSDEKALQNVLLDAAEKCGAQVIGHTAKIFEPHGLTMVIMLSESHASIHTYPEYGACFVDLFTCGDKCNHEIFCKVLQDYLKAKTVQEEVKIRKDHGLQR